MRVTVALGAGRDVVSVSSSVVLVFPTVSELAARHAIEGASQGKGQDAGQGAGQQGSGQGAGQGAGGAGIESGWSGGGGSEGASSDGVATVELLERVGSSSGAGKGAFNIVYSGAKVTAPFISCSYVAPPSPPHPPPYPPRPAPAPLRDCGLGATYILTKSFSKSYTVDVALRGSP